MSRPVVLTWGARAVWALAPVALGFAVNDLLSDRSSPVQLVVLVGLWAGWAGALVALLVPSTLGLTALRCLAPMSVTVAVGALVSGGGAGSTVAACAGATAVMVLTNSSAIGGQMVQGSAYGDETRFLLRPPAALLLGPVPVAWALSASALTGPLLFAARQWIAGALALGIGASMAWALLPRLHQLSRRWLVFVPAGVVIHDPIVLSETAMFRRAIVASIAPADIDATGLDLTGGASGLVLELALHEPTPIVVATARRQSATQTAMTVLFAPTQPGQVLADVDRRRLPIGPQEPSAY
jgi:hypothetical protein